MPPIPSAKVMQAEQMARDYHVSGVPTLVVGGQYVVTGQNVDGRDQRLTIARQLIDQVAAARH